jgi:hypothetical protein
MPEHPPEQECLHRWVLMSEKTVRLSAYTKQRRRRFYCQRCREVAEDRDREFVE